MLFSFSYRKMHFQGAQGRGNELLLLFLQASTNGLGVINESPRVAPISLFHFFKYEFYWDSPTQNVEFNGFWYIQCYTSYHYSQFGDIFMIPKGNPISLLVTPCFSPASSPQVQTSTYLPSILIDLCILDFQIEKNCTMWHFCICLLSIVLSRFVLIVAHEILHHFLSPSNIPLYRHSTWFMYPFIGWCASELFPFFGYYE